MHPPKKAMAIGLLILGSLAALFLHREPRNTGTIRVSGNIEVTDAEVSFKIPGRVAKRLVDEGEAVRAGQVVAELDSSDLTAEVALRQAELEAARAALLELEAGSRPEEIAQAEAAVHRAQAALDELLAGSRPQEIQAAQAVLRQAQADADRLQRDFTRYSRLVQDKAVSVRDFESIRSAHEASAAKVAEAAEHLKLVREGPRREAIAQARAALDEARQHYALVKAGPRKETIDQARARMQQAEDSLHLAQIRLDYATITSPLTGTVLSKNIEPGEYVSAGTPVVTVAELANVWLRAYIDETDLGRVKLGQTVQITTDTFPGKSYEGKVSFIASQAEFTPKNVQTEKERVKLVYRIKVDIPNPEMELKPGMPADGEILLDAKEP